MPGPQLDDGVLPKAELHVHIEGTLEPELALRLARRNGISLRHSAPGGPGGYAFSSLQSFLDIYYDNLAVLRQAEDFAELAEAYLGQAARQGVRHAEIFFDPQAHVSRGVPPHVIMEGLGAGLAGTAGRLGISAGLILCFLRDRGADAAMSCLGDFLPYRSQLLGVGLDSAEAGHPPGAFRDVFAAARSEGLHVVAHAGEEGPAGYIWEALDELGAERIDHGVRCLDDPALVARLRADQIPLTVCPLSNLSLRVFSSWADVPVVRMLDSGLMVTINSDDPAYFGGYIEDNYRALRTELGVEDARLRQIAANSLRASFMDSRRRQACLAELVGPEPAG